MLLVGCVADPKPRLDLDNLDGGLDARIVDARAPDAPAAVDVGVDADQAVAEDAAFADAVAPPDRGPDAQPDMAVGLDSAVPAPDAALDAALPALDAQPDPDAAELDAALDPDAAEPDAAVLHPDADAPDADPDADVLEPDGALPDAAVAPTRFITGQAEAADDRVAVTVQGGGRSVDAVDGRFRLGPLPAGEIELRFSAPAHQTERRTVVLAEDADLALEEAQLLYRGTRVAQSASRLYFRFDDAWLLWEADGSLALTELPLIAPRVLIEDNHEVMLGFVPGEDAVVVRRRTMPGLAGDLDLVPLDGSDPTALFVEAQPWVRWVGGEAMAMVHTRDALSRLEVVVPGEATRVLAEGVPWLLVTQLADGLLAWAALSEDGERFDLFLGDLDGAPPQQITEPESRATDAFLSTTPDRAGLLWLTPEHTLWRWTPDGGAEALADTVLASPRPRFLADGRLLFWRAGETAQSLFVLEPEGERLLVAEATSSTFQPVGVGFFVVQPGVGLWHGTFDGPALGTVIPAEAVVYRVSFGGALALADGQAVRYVVGGEASAIEGLPGGLSQLGTTRGGATVWAAAERTLWWIPGPGQPGAAAIVVADAPSAALRGARSGDALYVTDADGWRRVNVPPDDAPDVVFDARVARISQVLAGDTLLTYDADDALWQIDGFTGEGFGWAEHVTRIWRSGRGGWTAYTCDRGLFLVPTP
jgi:hypothetical protein